MVEIQLPPFQPSLGTYIDLLLHRNVPAHVPPPRNTHTPPPLRKGARKTKTKRVPPRKRPRRSPSPPFVKPPRREKPHISTPPPDSPKHEPDPPPKTSPPKGPYNQKNRPPPPPDYPHSASTASPGLIDHAIDISDGSITVNPGYMLRILKNSPEFFQVLKGTSYSSSDYSETVNGSVDFMFRASDLKIRQPNEACIMPGTYPFRGPSTFWYSSRNPKYFPPVSPF